MLEAISPQSTFDATAAATFREHLTPDALMVYLSSRLDALDTQVNDIFNRQQHTQAIQKALSNLRTALRGLETDGTTKHKDATLTRIHEALRDLTDLDSNMGAAVRDQLNQTGFAFADDTCTEAEMKATMDYLDSVGKDVDSSAQMDMIRLQSIMSARQTAIQLATNLVASLGESTKAIVSNIGR